MSVAPFRGALIGCGYVSRYHLAAWQEVSGARLVALCDLDAGRLAQASDRVPGARTYREAAALFAAGPLDFVEICTRPESHVELVALAARHGVHVLCQKPAATTAADLRAMVDACETAGVRLMIHENWRYRPWYRALRAEIDSGTIGRPIRLRLVHRDTRALRPDGFRDQPYFQEMPRLILLEMGCHLIDTARYLLGEVATVSATLGHFGAGHPGEDLATLSLQFNSGALGLLDLTWCAPHDLARPEWALNETVVEGTDGMLRLRLDGNLERVDLTGAIEHRPVPLPADDQVYLGGYIAAQTHFIEGLSRGIEHETSGHDTLRTMEVVWSAYRSAEEGRRVILPVS
jgi:predicted dehydrogenase